MSWVIFGGAGFIGTQLRRRIGESGYALDSYDNYDERVHGDNPSKSVDIQELDLSNFANLNSWKPSTNAKVVFLVADTSTGSSNIETKRQARLSIETLTNLLQHWDNISFKPSLFFLASSRAVYGEGSYRLPSGEVRSVPVRRLEELESRKWENLPADGEFLSNQVGQSTKPVSIYGTMKLAQELIASTWCYNHGVSYRCLRLQNVVGPGQSITNSYTGFLNLFITRALQGKAIDVYEDGQIHRDFIDVRDVANAITKVCNLKSPENNITLDLGSGNSHTINQVVDILQSKFPKLEVNRSQKFRLGDVRRGVANIAAAKEIFDWTPQYELEMTLNSMISSIQYKIKSPA